MGSDTIAIIGAGPCGLACAAELARLGVDDVVVLEAADHPGGCASSEVDPRGFTWDRGGHVVFSHFGDFDALVDDLMGQDLAYRDRSSYIKFDDRWVPYPFQNNLRHLPPEAAYECVSGLLRAPGASPDTDFATWMRGMFGPGITSHFMAPYNWKVWAHPAETMSARWIGERVSVVDGERALRNLVLGRDDVAWGPNSRFAYPTQGGTGEIFRRLARRLEDRIRYRAEVVSVDADGRCLRLADGEVVRYDALVSSMPLPRLVRSLVDAPAHVASAAGSLRSNGVRVVGVGFEEPLRDDRSWFYFPQDDVPFYRATNFARYAAANVPDSAVDTYCSYMTETSYSAHKPIPDDLVPWTVEGLRRSGLVGEDAPVASVHVIDVPCAYPIPTLDRDEALAVVQPWLMERRIRSRGRFGTWRYEVGNMDHAVRMGLEAARSLCKDEPEEVWCG